MSSVGSSSDTPPEGEALREYIATQNARSAYCKQKRAQLAALKAEVGVLVRTHEVLLVNEQEMGGSLFLEDQDGQRRGSLFGIDDEMSKADLTSLQKELRQMREQYQELKVSYDKKKRLHDSLTAGIDSEVTKVEQEIKKYWEEYITMEREKNLAEANLKILQIQKERLEQEKLIQKGRGSKEDGKRNSFWEELKIQIAMEEKETRQLKESQKAVNEGHEEGVRQVKLWKNLESLLAVKKKCLEAPRQSIGTVHRDKGTETLVLP